jgi:hypothetical protein
MIYIKNKIFYFIYISGDHIIIYSYFLWKFKYNYLKIKISILNRIKHEKYFDRITAVSTR